MRKFVLPTVLSFIFLYALSNSLGAIIFENRVYNLLVFTNFVCLLCLIIASSYGLMVQITGEKQVNVEDEDEWRLSIERTGYNTLIWTQVAFSISFVALISTFILVRETNPQIALYAFLLHICSLVGLVLVTSIIRYTSPEFTLPNPKSPTYQQELFDSLDDGQKHLMLKGLYKLYYWVIALLILLGIGLMFYSIFTNKSQLVSIVGIGFILLFIQTFYAISLKPKKAVL